MYLYILIFYRTNVRLIPFTYVLQCKRTKNIKLITTFVLKYKFPVKFLNVLIRHLTDMSGCKHMYIFNKVDAK